LGGIDNPADTEAFSDGLIGPSPLGQLLAGVSQHRGWRFLTGMPATTDQQEKKKLSRGRVQSRVLAATA